MFCTNCGKQIPDDMPFCEHCGAKNELVSGSSSPKVKKVSKETIAEKPNNTTIVQPTVAPVVSTPAALKKPMSKKTKIGLFVGIGAAVALLVTVVVISILPKTINIGKYVVFESSGYDGYGTASVHIDWEAFEEDNKNKLSFSKAMKEGSFGLSNFANPVDVLKNDIYFEESHFNNLSNGDTVEVKIVVNEKAQFSFNNKFKNLDSSYTISGLDELTKIDLLSVLKDPYVRYSGPNTKTYATPNYKNGEESTYNDGDLVISTTNGRNQEIHIVKDNQLIASVYYAIEEEGPFSNGDEITLKLVNVENLLNQGYAPKEDNIKVTVSDRPELITDVASLSEDSIKGYVSTYVYNLNMSNDYEPYSDHCYRNEESGSAFAMIAKPSTVTDHPYCLLIDLSYEYAYPGYKRTYTTNYNRYAVLSDLYVDGNSLCSESEDIQSYSSWGYSDIWKFINSKSSEYDFVQIY